MWDWLGEALAADFANTIRRRGAVDEERLRAPGDLAAWARRERGRVPPVAARDVAPRFEEVVALRDAVRRLLHAAVAGKPVAEADAEHVNAAARALPLAAQLRGGRVVREPVAPAAPLDELLARVAASAVELAGGGQDLGFCDAPSCGGFFVLSRANQHWCSEACGTRARVARHAARRRRSA